MFSKHLGISLKPKPVVPQMLITRNGETKHFGGYLSVGRTSDVKNRLYDFATLLQESPNKAFQADPELQSSGGRN